MRSQGNVAVLSLLIAAWAAGPASGQDGVPGGGGAGLPGEPGGYVDAPLAPEGVSPPNAGAVPGSTFPDGVTPDGVAPDGVGPDGVAIDSGAPAQGVRPAAGERGRPELLPGVIDSQIKKCWAVPVMTGDPAEGGIARIRVKLSPDGRLEEPPAIIDKPAGRLGTVFAESAATAISKCAPYRLPPEQYQSWRELMLHFDTLDF